MRPCSQAIQPPIFFLGYDFAYFLQYRRRADYIFDVYTSVWATWFLFANADLLQRAAGKIVLKMRDDRAIVLAGAIMKIIIITILLATSLVIVASAQTGQAVLVCAGKQATAKQSGLTVKFVEVLEDSRCPTDANCIWAGNARIKIEVTNKDGGEKTFELNTSSGPKGDQFDGWAIDLESLTPAPRSAQKTDPQSYQAKITISRLTR
jgi:hypothetical protein